MKSKLKIALIGCGNIGTRHAKHISTKADLVAVCDIDKNKLEKISEKYNVSGFQDYKDLLRSNIEIDLVSVCTPNGFHFEHTVDCLNSNCHVLVEKPMALSSFHCGEMIKTSERKNKRLFVVKQNRFNPPILKLKELINQNILGKINFVQLNCYWNRNNDYYLKSEWKGSKELDGGILFTQYSHFIDLLYWLIGDIKKVETIVKNFIHENIIEFEDTGVSIIEFNNGCIGSINFTINSFKKNMEGSITIFAEKGTVKVGGQYLNQIDYQCIEDYEIENLTYSNKPNDYGDYQGSMSNHDLVYDNVIDVLMNNSSIVTNCFEGLKTVEIIEKIYNSAYDK